MSLRKKLIIFFLISALASSITGLIIVTNTVSLQKEIEKQGLISEMLHKTFEQALLRDQYLVFREDRSIEQWHITAENIEKLLLRISKLSQARDERAFLQKINENSKAVEKLFLQLTERIDRKAEPSALDLALEKKIATQFLIKSQDYIAIISELEELSRDRVKDIQGNNSLLIVLFTLFLNGIILGTIVWVWFSIVKPLALFERAEEALSKQEFRSVDIRSDDEIGSLARTFNKMSEKLKQAHIKQRDQMDELNKKTVTLEEKTLKLESTNKFMVDRELKMVELKEKVRQLEETLGQTEPH